MSTTPSSPRPLDDRALRRALALGARRGLCAVVALGAALSLSAGCGPGASPSAPDSAKEQATARALPSAEFVRGLLPGLAGTLHARLSQRLPPPAPEAGLREALSAEGLTHGAAASALYVEDKHALLFTQRGGLTPVGEEVYKALGVAHHHGIDRELVHAKQLEALRGELDAQRQAILKHSADFPKLDAAHIQQLAEILGSAKLDPSEAERYLSESMLDPDSAHADKAPQPIRAWMTEHETLLAQGDAVLPRLEALLADGFLVYAHRLRYRNPRYQAPELKEAHGEEKAGELMVSQAFRDLRQLARGGGGTLHTGDHASPQALIDALAPPHAQYARLVKALPRYEAIAASGGWPTDFPKWPRPLWGKKQTTYDAESKSFPEGLVQKVQTRLKVEGYYSGPLDGAWNEAFTKAILDFRAAHQLYAKERIDYDLLEAMRPSAEWRVAQLKLALERWRESPIADDAYYIFINIPDFHGEVWDQGALAHRFRVVVGDTAYSRSRKKFYNATPTLSAKVETVVFNPSWSVPARIKAHELDRKLEKNPNWYEENGFEVSERGGRTFVRQKPGPNNALGEVKILFPNPHSVYLHDTPSKSYFKLPVRAFSHGCMRVHEPVKLAAEILKREDPKRWGEYETVRRMTWGNNENFVRIANGPAVHVDYITARVSDDGRVHFLTDVYAKDKARIEAEYGLKL